MTGSLSPAGAPSPKLCPNAGAPPNPLLGPPSLNGEDSRSGADPVGGAPKGTVNRVEPEAIVARRTFGANVESVGLVSPNPPAEGFEWGGIYCEPKLPPEAALRGPLPEPVWRYTIVSARAPGCRQDQLQATYLRSQPGVKPVGTPLDHVRRLLSGDVPIELVEDFCPGWTGHDVGRSRSLCRIAGQPAFSLMNCRLRSRIANPRKMSLRLLCGMDTYHGGCVKARRAIE